MGKWKHRERMRNDNTPDPVEKAFFSNEMVKSISNALTREGNQNVLDEVKDVTQPARVKIFLSGNKYALSPEVYLPFLAGLVPHLQAEKNGIIKSELPDFRKSMPFLLFEDFNTKGLEGKVDESSYADIYDLRNPHNFYFFWRAYGRSGKLAGKMGSWGVGKSVFPALSKINSFWALTIRDSDKKAYLIGQSVLKTHNRDDLPALNGYFPYGYFGKFATDDFALPEDSLDELQKFSDIFSLRRKVNDDLNERSSDTGLSLIIPFPKPEINVHTIALATLEQFFFPLLLGKLEVEVVEEDFKIDLNRHSLSRALKQIDLSKVPGAKESIKISLQSTFDFAKWLIEIAPADYHRLSDPNPEHHPVWNRAVLFQSLDIGKLRREFENGKPMAFIIPIKIQPEGKPAELKHFKAFLQKDEKLTEPENHVIREYLTITGIRSLKKKGVRGIVLLEDRDLVTFFGHAEGPAHTGWHKDNFKVKYEQAESCISFVQRSLEMIYSHLLIPAEGLNKDLLKDLFYVNIEDNNALGAAKAKGEDAPKIPKDIPSSLPRKVIVNQIDGGFRITSNTQSESLIEKIDIKVAYATGSGNPLKQYSIFDFDLKHADVQTKNMEILVKEKNKISIRPTEKNFEMEVLGFDRRRDLFIDIKPLVDDKEI